MDYIHTHRKIMLRSRIGRTKVETHYPNFLDIGSSPNGSIEVLV